MKIDEDRLRMAKLIISNPQIFDKRLIQDAKNLLELSSKGF